MIKQIKTFVEQLKNKYPSWQLKLAMDELFSFLDTFKEPIDKWSNKERTARVKETGEIVHGFTDGQGHFDIPTDHNEFIRYNLDELEFDTLQEQPVDWQKVAEAHTKDQPLGQDNNGNLVYLQEQPVMIKWTGNNLKEVIEFTGKSPRFDEWFKTWDEYESYVHSHGNIFKLFNEDGTHLEVPVGAWIFKTPDGQNVPSTFLYQEQPVCEELGREMDRFFTSEEYEEAEKAGFGEAHAARHFAQWGEEHRSSSETPNNLNEAAKFLFPDPDVEKGTSVFANDEWSEVEKLRKAFILGVQWGVEHLKKNK